MSKPTTENPKVFISYAWGSEEFQEKVLSFATDLVNDGIDVIYDRWSLKEGNDTYKFMEQCVNDSSINNVLILLSPNYEKKANERSGGVGTETQIISPEIYNRVEQEKFLPVVFEVGENGEVPKPTYLKGLLHFDLSDGDRYDTEYQRLVKRLYGIEIVKKPELGNRPAWLETTATVGVKVRNSYSVLKSNLANIVKKEQLESYLSDLKNKILEFKKEETFQGEMGYDAYIALYEETKTIRDEFILLMRHISFVDDGEKLVATKFEEIHEILIREYGIINDIRKTLLHELFIYVIAIYYKSKNYEALSYTLNKTYFTYDFQNPTQSFTAIYYNNEHLDNAMNKRDNKKYHSGTAQYWIDNINTEICSKNDFIFADELCYNASIFANCKASWHWFPLTYVYDNYNAMMRKFSIRLQSKEHLSETASIFGHSVESFKRKFSIIEANFKNDDFKYNRYSGHFEYAPILCEYIKSEELGILN
ncbi:MULTISPECIES: toll/interleukin-1 receptor domain-containing protein [unclassified Lacrimispora]|uniref:toll/interleukin-1 receptor domain-containing protein n=1 Tax=unclassified Lacrimispora TaxID=2719232 RepID=UPI00377030A5